jgi:hypothetical protein
VELFEDQKSALEELKVGSILCGGVGSGKSLTSLSYFLKEHADKTLYIITTAKNRDDKSWDQEVEKLGRDIHYTVDSWNNIKKYVEVQNGFFIFDEQRVVGSGAWVRSFFKITKLNPWILLSATPGDVWMDYYPVFRANGYYRTKADFVSQHVVFDRFSKYPRIDKYINTGQLERLRDRVLIPMSSVRHTKRHEKLVKVDYNSAVYNMLIKERWDIYNNEPIKNHSKLAYLKRKVVNDDPTRLDALDRIFRERKRLVVFYSYDYELERLREFSKRKGYTFGEWNGHKHEPIPEFSHWLYFVNYGAGAEGWNCITTDTIVFYSLQYSYKVVEQASGRIDRRNTPYTDLYYYTLFSDAPIDTAIRKANQAKKNFNEAAFMRQFDSQENHAL